jgi:membrane-bound lytic murein transglycosylase D
MLKTLCPGNTRASNPVIFLTSFAQAGLCLRRRQMVPQMRKNFLHRILMMLSCGLMLFAFGCATNSANITGLTQEEWTEELVEGLELPEDDGQMLYEEERTAMDSTGMLDAELTPAQKLQVERHFKYYLHTRRTDFERYLQRAETYLPYIHKVFTEMGLPQELANLVIVESGFNPNAVSRAGATGMWQFMRGTGTRFGLANNYWLDERRDPYKSTVAAANYLKQLYDMFGDWHLAIASYNAGEGKISRAMEQTGAEDFFELCRLNQGISARALRLRPETQQYVPRFLAVTKIMRNLELLGFSTPKFGNAPEITPVTVGPGADLAAMARSIGMEYGAFKSINPAYRKNISPVSSSSTAYVPAKYAEPAAAWLAQPQASRFAGWQRYKVRRGDSLYVISQRYGISVPVLSQANNLTGKTIREGAVILVPGGVASAGVQKAQTLPVAGETAANAGKSRVAANADKVKGRPIHTVRRGENLYRISLNYGISLASLLEANGIDAKDSHLMAGQKLVIPASGGTAAQNKARGVYVVQKGDTLYSLAQRNNISLAKLLRLNSLTPGVIILPGQELLIP